MTKHLVNALLTTSLAILYYGCSKTPSRPDKWADTELTLINLFPNCHTTVSGNTRVAYQGVIEVYYYDGSRRISSSHIDFTSGSDPATPIVKTISVPDGSPYDVEVVAESTQCSDYALEQVGNDFCYHSDTPNGRKAARPREDFQSDKFGDHRAKLKFDMSTSTPISNADCGCLVPY